MREHEQNAAEFVKAIKTIAEKPQNLENLEIYLSCHFEQWLTTWANTPEKLAHELKIFANMDI